MKKMSTRSSKQKPQELILNSNGLKMKKKSSFDINSKEAL